MQHLESLGGRASWGKHFPGTGRFEGREVSGTFTLSRAYLPSAREVRVLRWFELYNWESMSCPADGCFGSPNLTSKNFYYYRGFRQTNRQTGGRTNAGKLCIGECALASSHKKIQSHSFCFSFSFSVFVLFCFVLFSFFDMLSVCSSGCPGTHSRPNLASNSWRRFHCTPPPKWN